MTRVAILQDTEKGGKTVFRAVAGAHQAVGGTAGEALDAISTSLAGRVVGSLFVVQSFQPDAYFTEAHQNRMEALMQKWRTSRDHGEALSAEDQAELDALVETEVRAAMARTVDARRQSLA